MGRTFNSVRNIYYGFISKIITIFLPFLIRTSIIYCIGIEYAGLNSLFTAILNFLSLSELGFGSAVVYMLYKPVSDNNIDQISKIVRHLKKVYLFIGLAIFGVGICLLPFLDNLISGEYPSDANLYVLYIIFLLNTSVSYFLFAHKSVLFSAYQRIDITNKITATVTLISGIFQISLILITHNYLIYAICIPVFTIIQNVTVGFISIRKFPEIKCYGELDKDEKNDIRSKVFALTGHKIGGTIVGSLDSIVVSAILGLSILAQYSSYFLVISALMGFINIIMQSTLPSVGNYLLGHSDIEKEHLFKKLNFIMVWVIGWCSVCLLCLYQPFVKVWLGESLLLPFTTVIWFCVYFYSWQFRVLIVNFKDAAGLWNEDILKPYIASIVNVILNIFLVKRIGLDGALISTIICMVLIFFPWETEVLYRKLFHQSSAKFYCNELRSFIIWVCLAIATYEICSIIKTSNTFVEIFTRSLICIFFPNALYILINIKSEYAFFCFGFIRNTFKRGKAYE